MNINMMNSLPKFLETLGLNEEPMGLFIRIRNLTKALHQSQMICPPARKR